MSETLDEKKARELRERWTPERVDKIIESLQKGENWTVHLAGLPHVEEVARLSEEKHRELGLGWKEDFGRDLRHIDLVETDLTSRGLSRVDLRHADLYRANLCGTNLSGGDLQHATLGEADLKNATLKMSVLAAACLYGANLEGAVLQGANLRGANLQKARLRRAQFQKANLEHAWLQDSDLSEANLQEATLTEAYIDGADLSGASLQNANLSDLSFQRMHMEKVNFQGAKLDQAEFQKATLYMPDFTGANLEYAGFAGTKLMCADFRDAQLTSADFRGADLFCSTFRGAFLSRVEFQGADLSHCDLSGASTLEWAQFDGSKVGESTVVFLDQGVSRFLRRDKLPGEPSARERLLATPGEARRVFFRFLRYRKRGTPRSRAMMCEGIKRILAALRTPRQVTAMETEWERLHRELKQAFKDKGLYAEAGRHYYRQMVYRRRRKWRERKPYRWLCPAEWLLFDVLSGYGERPHKVIGWMIAVIMTCALVYWTCGEKIRFAHKLAEEGLTHITGFGQALYFSTVTFTTLGFGDWYPDPTRWIRFLVMTEALLGALLIAMALVTYARLAIRD